MYGVKGLLNAVYNLKPGVQGEWPVHKVIKRPMTTESDHTKIVDKTSTNLSTSGFSDL